MLKLNNRCLVLHTIKKYILLFLFKIKRLIIIRYNHFKKTILDSKKSIFFFYFNKILEKIRLFYFVYNKKIIFFKKTICYEVKIFDINFLNYLRLSFRYFKFTNNYLGRQFSKSSTIIFLLNKLKIFLFLSKMSIKNLIYQSFIKIEKKKLNKNLKRLFSKKKFITFELKKKSYFFFFNFKNLKFRKINILYNKITNNNNLISFLTNKQISKIYVHGIFFKIIFGIECIPNILSNSISLAFLLGKFSLQLFIIYLDFISFTILFNIKNCTFLKNKLNNNFFVKYSGFLNKNFFFLNYIRFLKYKKNQIFKTFFKKIFLFFVFLKI
jgi:hypothetical protein